MMMKPTSLFQKSISFKSLSQHSSKKADVSLEVNEKSRSTSPPVTDKPNQPAPTEELPDSPKMPDDNKLQDVLDTSVTTVPNVAAADKDQSGGVSADTVGLTNDKPASINDDSMPTDKEVANENQISDMVSIEDDKKSFVLSELTEKVDTLSHVGSRGNKKLNIVIYFPKSLSAFIPYFDCRLLIIQHLLASSGTVLSTHTIAEDPEVLAIDKNSALQIGEVHYSKIN